jgi:hypothetical protein
MVTRAQAELWAHQSAVVDYLGVDAVVNSYAMSANHDARPESVGMAKYDPLTDFLTRQDQGSIRMSFQRLEEIITASLPPSARSDRTWWGNTLNQTRVQAHAWLGAGWEVEAVDFAHELVTFTRGRR